MDMNDKIDFVVAWVDGDDPKWQKDRDFYLPKNTDDVDNRNARFRDWDQLKYWFRAVEKNAPWVNKIHFVTYGHLPDWLDVNNPKLHIVNHKDFIPEKYLPVFNSTAIEVHLHRIPTLSEQFVYFNDDCYLMKPCKESDFFKKGKPVDMAKLSNVLTNQNEMDYYHLYNDYSIYTNYLSKKNILKLFFKYVNPRYGKAALHNIFNLLAKNMYFYPLHLPEPFLRSSIDKVWAENYESLDKTAKSRFRKVTNNSQALFRGYQLITGDFYPKNRKGMVLDTRNAEYAKQMIENFKYKYLCMSE